jgi:hypothetical protein
LITGIIYAPVAKKKDEDTSTIKEVSHGSIEKTP